MQPDIATLEAAQRGDVDAMSALLSPWNDPLFGFILQLVKNRADAEDATQETFIRIVKGLEKYEHRGEFAAWIFQIARNQAMLTAGRRNRTQSRELNVEPEVLQAAPDYANDAATTLELVERTTQIRNAVAALPQAEREIVELRLNQDLKFREIASLLHTPLNTVLGRMHNAMRRLRESLQFLQP